ncbi:MAG: AMP-binding protein [Pseudomonadota bacterium]
MNHLYDGLLTGAAPDRQFATIPGTRPRWYTYAHVDDVSGRFAAKLAARGVVPGDRVAAQVEKSIEAIMLYLGAVRAGAVFLPLNTAYTPAEVATFLDDAEPRVFLCDPSREAALAPVAKAAGARLDTFGIWGEGPAGTFLDEAEAAGESLSVPRAADDLAAILYTSGTTGRSKGAMLSHGNLLSNAKTLAALWHFTADDHLIHALPIFHVHGLFVATNIVLAAKASMHVLPKFDAATVTAAMENATALMGVPTFYTRLLDHPAFTREAAAGMRLFVSGSAPLLAETHQAFEARTGHKILERYGMTETGMNTSNPYEGARKAGTVGPPLPDVAVRVVDEAGAPVPVGAVGAVEVKGPNVFQGYWRLAEKTAEEMCADGFFKTGDLGSFDEEGYLTIVGRSKDLIISGGFNVYPKEVELAIDTHEGVLESAVIGVPHKDFGEGVMAVVVRRDAAVTADALAAHLGEALARYKQPKAFAFVDALPRNAMGKVQKAELRKIHADAFSKPPG